MRNLIIWLVVSLPALFITAGYRDEHGLAPFGLVLALSLAFAWVLRPARDEQPAPVEVDRR